MTGIELFSILDRLARLEKVVFETVDNTGCIKERLTNLEKAVFNAASD